MNLRGRTLDRVRPSSQKNAVEHQGEVDPMTPNRRNGFTLVEILIVVVILGILAALVVPQFSSATQDALRSSLARQVQMINQQIELYRIGNDGVLPTADPDDPMGEGGTKSGWGALISFEYLKEQPYNAFTKSFLLAEGDFATAAADLHTSDNGWYYDQTDGLIVYAAGYNKVTNQLSNELD